MKRWIIMWSIALSTVLPLYADETREHVQAEILKHLDEVERARAEVIRALERTVKEVDEARAKASLIRGESIQTQITEAESIAKIAEATALVELAKVDAKKRIAKIVDRAEVMSQEAESEVVREKIRAEAIKEIAAAVAQVEITKAQATKVILEVTGDVERSKVVPQAAYVDGQSALTIARNKSAVRIAKAVSAVEIAKAAARVELARTDTPHAKNSVAHGDAPGLDVLRAKAKAAISTAMASVEVAHANAVAEVANEVSAVEIAEKSAAKALQTSLRHQGAKPAYPKHFLYFKKQ